MRIRKDAKNDIQKAIMMVRIMERGNHFVSEGKKKMALAIIMCIVKPFCNVFVQISFVMKINGSRNFKNSYTIKIYIFN